MTIFRCRFKSIVTGLSVLTLALTATSAASRADDWPQWMGPQRDGIWRETDTVTSIPADGLPVRWRATVRGGYSGPAVADGRVYITDYVRQEGELSNDPRSRTGLAGSERVLCLDATTGLMLWQYEYECPYSISYASGPRCTPTVDDGRVYVVGAEGNLLCLNTADGNLLWEKNFKRDYEAQTPLWGFCGHPLIVDDLLICLVGGEGSVAVAFDRVTGVERWRACSASEQGYCPPTLITVSGQQQLLIWDADKINSLAPATGELLWSTALKPSYGMSIMAPQVGRLDGQQVLFASGIGRVGALFALNQDRPEATVIWRGEPKSAVYCANSTPFIDGDTLYGCDCHTGMLTAVDLASGERLWETTAATTGSDRPAKHGTGFLVRQPAAEGGFLTWIFTETGDLLLTRLTREAYEERGRAHLLEPTNECFGRPVVWSHPAFADRCCFVRNDEELICVSLAELRPQD